MNSIRLAPRTAAAAVAFTLLTSVAFTSAIWGADPGILTGTIASPAGENMGGVTVSAKAVGSTIATTVFTDEAGNYYFPPLPPGQYRIWAQARSFETAAGEGEAKPGTEQTITRSRRARIE